MFRINDRRHAARFLRVGDDVHAKRRFTGRFRAEDFNNSSARKPHDAERNIKRKRSGADHRHIHG